MSAERRRFRTGALLPWVAIALSFTGAACASDPRSVSARDASSPLHLEREISLPGVKGRIDHLAIDLPGKRLFVSEVGNGSVEVIDLASGRSLIRIGALNGPQGIAWLPASGEFLVACEDGTVHFYSGRDYRETATIGLGSDADDVRVDPRNGRAVVGYGDGGLAVIDPASHRVVSRIQFKGHPEGFALAAGKAWVNDPDDGAVLALDLDDGKLLARWPTGLRRYNFPMALSADDKQVVIAYRLPAAMARIDAADGAVVATQDTCGDADDVYALGDRVLVVCGAGAVDVLRGDGSTIRVKTRAGARTGLYAPELDTLFVAAPTRGGGPAAIWQLRLAA